MQPSWSARVSNESCTFSKKPRLCRHWGFRAWRRRGLYVSRSIPLRQCGAPALKGTCRLSLWTLEKQNPWVKFSWGDGNGVVFLHCLLWVWISPIQQVKVNRLLTHNIAGHLSLCSFLFLAMTSLVELVAKDISKRIDNRIIALWPPFWLPRSRTGRISGQMR